MLLMHPLSASAVMGLIYTEVGDTEDKVVGCGCWCIGVIYGKNKIQLTEKNIQSYDLT